MVFAYKHGGWSTTGGGIIVVIFGCFFFVVAQSISPVPFDPPRGLVPGFIVGGGALAPHDVVSGGW
jgi:hypothetical protein